MDRPNGTYRNETRSSWVLECIRACCTSPGNGSCPEEVVEDFGKELEDESHGEHRGFGRARQA